MKLLYCRDCKDIIRMRPIPRKCYCGGTIGKLLDSQDIEFSGNCSVIEINNRSLKNADNRAWLRSTKEHFEALINYEEFAGKYDPPQ